MGNPASIFAWARRHKKDNNISFNIMQSVCKYNGKEWKDNDHCNHIDFRYNGELNEGGYIIRSDQPCNKNVCPLLKT